MGLSVATVKVSIMDLPSGKDIVVLTFDNFSTKELPNFLHIVATRVIKLVGLDPYSTEWTARLKPTEGDVYEYRLIHMNWLEQAEKYGSAVLYLMPPWMRNYIEDTLSQPINLPLHYNPSSNQLYF